MSVPSASGTMPVASAAAAPAAAAARAAGQVVGVAGGAEHLVHGVRAGAELGGVGLADRDRPGRAHPPHDRRVLAAGTWSANTREPYVVRMPAVSVRSLCATGSPCSGPRQPPARQVRVGLARLLAAPARPTSVTIALTSAVDPLDPAQVRLDQLDRARSPPRAAARPSRWRSGRTAPRRAARRLRAGCGPDPLAVAHGASPASSGLGARSAPDRRARPTRGFLHRRLFQRGTAGCLGKDRPPRPESAGLAERGGR